MKRRFKVFCSDNNSTINRDLNTINQYIASNQEHFNDMIRSSLDGYDLVGDVKMCRDRRNRSNGCLEWHMYTVDVLTWNNGAMFTSRTNIPEFEKWAEANDATISTVWSDGMTFRSIEDMAENLSLVDDIFRFYCTWLERNNSYRAERLIWSDAFEKKVQFRKDQRTEWL